MAAGRGRRRPATAYGKVCPNANFGTGFAYAPMPRPVLTERVVLAMSGTDRAYAATPLRDIRY
eukprot:2336101-Rhodomonas_salina.5